ncbi:MAG: hypothetical protein AAB481_02700, partial [Patescibacteria group bacterium]
SPTRILTYDYDLAALNRVKRYSDQLARYYGAPNAVLIMPADVYAIEINGDNPDRVTTYFSEIRVAANDLGFSVQPWSAIREQNLDLYEEILQWECSPEALFRSTPKALWYDGLFPAALSRNSALGEDAVHQSAFRYLQERIVEARVIEAVYTPIKLSMVSKQKDDIVDRELPRVYILEKELKFPWLKGS